MVVFPGCKINIGLNITGKRADGYHEIESVFYPLNLSDILEIIENDQFLMETTGLPIPGDARHNLVKKAYDLLQEQYDLPPVKIHLHKVVPMGAGLGGGSADGAAVLVVLNQLFKLGIADHELEVLADQLGSDCAFFVKNKAAYVTGKGEKVEHIDFDLSSYYIQLINPAIHISTKEAFQGIKIEQTDHNLLNALHQSPERWSDLGILNAFEPQIITHHDAIGQIKAKLIENGALYASMTGTGSSVYGIFRKKPQPAFSHLFEWIANL